MTVINCTKYFNLSIHAFLKQKKAANILNFVSSIGTFDLIDTTVLSEHFIHFLILK